MATQPSAYPLRLDETLSKKIKAPVNIIMVKYNRLPF